MSANCNTNHGAGVYTTCFDRFMTSPATPATATATTAHFNPGLIAFFRVGVALMWIQNVAWKRPPDFGEGDPPRMLYRWTRNAVDHEVFAPYAWVVDNVVLPNFTVFGWAVLILEASLGAFLLVGLFTRAWALLGVAQTVAITLSALNAPHEWYWAYLLMGLVHVALFATAAGQFYGVDGVLRGRHSRDGAVTAIGVTSLVSLVFIADLGDFRFIVITNGAIVVCAALGLLAIMGGLRGGSAGRTLAMTAGLGFVVAAVLQVILVASGQDWLGGNLTTTSFWLGLGVGLLAVSFADRLTRVQERLTSRVHALGARSAGKTRTPLPE